MASSLVVLTAALLLVAVAVFAVVFAATRRRSDEAISPRLEALAAAQSEIAGRFAQALAGQTELQTMLAGRLDTLDRRLGDSLKETASRTAETLGGIQTRLSVIDEAQKNITALSGQVVSLQEILANKQARGAFGQQQMEAIIADALPPALYSFQATLSNGSRRILESLGTWNGVCAAATAIRKIHVSDQGGFGFARIDAAYRDLARAEPRRISALDGELPPDRVLGDALAAIEDLL